MNTAACPDCTAALQEAQRVCHACGYTLRLEPMEAEKDRYLHRPSLGGLLWTQAYALGTRQYLWFVASLIPGVGFVALFAMSLYGRRWSWRMGGWESFSAFQERQRLMDGSGFGWICALIVTYTAFRVFGH